MHYLGVFTALTALSGLAVALPRPNPPKQVPIKYDALHEIRSLNTNTGSVTRRAIESGAKILKPIKVHPSFTKRSDGEHEDSIDFSRLDLGKQAQLVYGSPDSDGSLLLAHMTLHAPDGKPIIMMESFETLTNSIDCNGSDGKLSLTFKNRNAMIYALTKWAYINEKEDDEFILIANHEGCGPSEERIPYLISEVKNDGLVTYLTAKQEKWENISGNFEIDFGKSQAIKPKTAPSRRAVKDFFKDLGNKVEDTANDIKNGVEDGVEKAKDGIEAVGDKIKNAGSGNLEKELNIPLNTERFSGMVLFSDPLGILTVECLDCSITGSLKLTGRVAVKNFKPTELTFTASPVDFLTTVQFSVNVVAGTSDLTKPPTFSKNIAALPLGGIIIPQVFSLGPKLDFELGASVKVDGDAYFTFGIMAGLPNDAVIKANVLNPLKSEASGFEGAIAEIIPFTVESMAASMTASAFAMPVLSIGFEVLGGAFGAETSIKFKTPSINAEMSVEFDELGVCNQKEGASKTGVRIKTSGTAEGSFFVGTDQTVGEVAALNKVLFKKSFLTIPATCIEVDIPGLDKVPAGEEEITEELPVEEEVLTEEEVPTEEVPVEEEVLTEEVAPTEEVPVEEEVLTEEVAPTEEVPVEEVPTEEVAPTEEVLIEEEVAPTEEVPVEGEVLTEEVAPTEEVPVEEEVPTEEVAPTEEVPVEEEVLTEEVAPTEEVPIEEEVITEEEAPVEDAPVDETLPAEEAPVEEAPIKIKTPTKKPPVKKAPVKKAPVKKTPVKKIAAEA